MHFMSKSLEKFCGKPYNLRIETRHVLFNFIIEFDKSENYMSDFKESDI